MPTTTKVNRKFVEIPRPDENYETKRQKALKALHTAYEEAEAGNWDIVLDLGLQFPVNMDKLINAYYAAMPENIRYKLPVMWYMASGKASDVVCEAVKNAKQYRPSLWIGRGSVKHDSFDVFCCLRQGNAEDARSCLSWAIDYNTAYLEAQKIGGRVFQGFITKDKLIAYNSASVMPVIQYQSVYAVQQVFPKIPLSAMAGH